jgi:hypothetical protein
VVLTVEEKMAASHLLLFFGVLLLTVWIALGTAAFWLVSSWFGWAFLLFSVFSVLVVLRRLMCSSCYYCRSCTKGFGKMSKLFLGGRRIPGIGGDSSFVMVVALYVILSLLPSAVLVSSMFQEFTALKLLLLMCLVSITVVHAIVRLKNWFP